MSFAVVVVFVIAALYKGCDAVVSYILEFIAKFLLLILGDGTLVENR